MMAFFTIKHIQILAFRIVDEQKPSLLPPGHSVQVFGVISGFVLLPSAYKALVHLKHISQCSLFI